MQDQSLIDKLKFMSKDDLENYLITARITSWFSIFMGVGCILLTLIFTNIFTVAAMLCTLYIFGNIAVASESITQYIDILMTSPDKDK